MSQGKSLSFKNHGSNPATQQDIAADPAFAGWLTSALCSMDTKILKRRKRSRRLYRLIGFMFSLVGGMLAISGLFLLLDPEATLNCNGVVSNSPSCKRQFTLFGAMFFVIGLGLLFAKGQWLDRLFLWRESISFANPVRWGRKNEK